MKSEQRSCTLVYIVIILSCLVGQCYVKVTRNDFYKHTKAATTLTGNNKEVLAKGIKYPHWSNPENEVISVCNYFKIFLYFPIYLICSKKRFYSDIYLCVRQTIFLKYKIHLTTELELKYYSI